MHEPILAEINVSSPASPHRIKEKIWKTNEILDETLEIDLWQHVIIEKNPNTNQEQCASYLMGYSSIQSHWSGAIDFISWKKAYRQLEKGHHQVASDRKKSSPPKKVYIGERRLISQSNGISTPDNQSINQLTEVCFLWGTKIKDIAKKLTKIIMSTDYYPLLLFHVRMNNTTNSLKIISGN